MADNNGTGTPAALNFGPPRSGFESPLLDFEGDLKEIVVEQRQTQAGSSMQIAKFNFTNVKVFDAREPYLFPIATVEVIYSTFGDKNAWAVLTESIRKLLPGDADIAQIPQIITGRKHHWKWSPAVLQGPLKDEDGNDVLNAKGKKTYVDVSGEAWKVLEIEGFGATGGSLYDDIIDLIDGKTTEGFQQVFFGVDGNPLKKYSDYRDAVNAMTDDSLLPMLESQGKITRDAQGIWHKAVAEVTA